MNGNTTMEWIYNIYRYVWIGVVACLAGCADKLPQNGQPVELSFRMGIQSKEGATGLPVSSNQLVRLYLAERKPEAGKPIEDAQHEVVLSCENYYNLDEESYHLMGLQGVWHKFAFVCVPDVEKNMGRSIFPSDIFFMTYKDLYDFQLNYEAVLDYQAKQDTVVTKDLAVYRKIMDRWIDADMPTSEDVLMSRITGQLVLNMGKPANQFDTAAKGRVKAFGLRIGTSKSCFIRDEACDSVIITARVNKEFTWKVDSAAQKKEQILTIALLPGELSEALVTVAFERGEPEAYPLRGKIGTTALKDITIKKNTRTVVLFNGMKKDMFEVRYAGFADGNDATVDVDDDAWDGVEM